MKRAVLFVTALVFAAIVYARVDRAEVVARLTGADFGALGGAIGMFVPLLGLSAVRWQWLVRDHGGQPRKRVALREALRETLAANALNLVTPAKLGDLSKAYLATHRRGVDSARAAGAVVLEKLLDVAALCGLLLGGGFLERPWLLLLPGGYLAALAILFAWPPHFAHPAGASRCDAAEPALGRKLTGMLRSVTAAVRTWRSRPAALVVAVGLSVALWTLHLAQVYLLFRAVHAAVPLWQVCTRGPVAILAGLLPLSWWGIGTRDAVFLEMFRPWAPAPAIAAAGALFLLRYLVPGVLGLPFLGDFAPTRVGDDGSRARDERPPIRDPHASMPRRPMQARHDPATVPARL